jgi:4a-hydroxytetrahydrobiopterin dehydratase
VKKERLTPPETQRRLALLPGWKIYGVGILWRQFVMKDFLACVALIDGAARAAQTAGHHPDVHLTDFRNLVFELSTHDAGGLTAADFALAEKIDALPKRLQKENPHDSKSLGSLAGRA